MFMVGTWDNRSEARYYYGPFRSEAAAQMFCEKLPEQYVDIDIYCLNSAKLAGTGQEIS